MNYYYLLIPLLLVVGCASPQVTVESKARAIEPPCVLQGGVEEPYYPPYVWVQPPGDTLWYPGGQCRSDEELGKHGH